MIETLHDFPVSTRRGHALVVALAVIGIIILVAAGVTIFTGAPPPIDEYGWPMAGVGALFLGGGIVRHVYRRRRLRIVRTDTGHHLVVDRERVRLEFPIDMQGTQLENNINGIPTWEVWFRIVDANRRGIFLTETRGAIHGPQDDWWVDNLDRASGDFTRFEAGRVGMLAKLRDAIEAINESAYGRKSE